VYYLVILLIGDLEDVRKEGVDVFPRQGGQGQFWAFSVLHHIQNT